eukprot:tig00000940_g5541.t1
MLRLARAAGAIKPSVNARVGALLARPHATNAVATPAYSELSSVPLYQQEKKIERFTPGDENRRPFAYLVIGSARFAYMAWTRVAVLKVISTMSASADVLALASVEVDVSSIPVGQNVTIKWRGKPVFIRHRTAAEIAEAGAVNISELRHQETDAQRAQKPNFLIMLGVCTHLGCVPLGNAGDYNGWFCPCHGSHYDISGRIRKGPAPLNLEVPPYKFTSDSTVLIG